MSAHAAKLSLYCIFKMNSINVRATASISTVRTKSRSANIQEAYIHPGAPFAPTLDIQLLIHDGI